MELDKVTRDQLYGQLSYQDMQGMNLIERTGRTAASIPVFASNDNQFRSVLAHAAITYIYRSKKPPNDIVEDLKHLDGLARDVHSRELQIDPARWQRMQEHFAAIDQAGGYLALLGAIAYRAWRLRWHNADIACSLAMQKAAVQHVLDKLKRIAVLMGFETCRPTERRLAWLSRKAAVDEAIIDLWKQGKSTGQIVQELHVGITRVTNLLRWKGLYTWRRRVVRHGFKRPNVAKAWERRRALRK